jgi:cellulose synthase/poly-beta-1,6-N-acetylglucosamine synthase-like glycosyltransferase
LVEDTEMTTRLYRKNWRIEPMYANVWQEEVEDPIAYLRQRRRWYQFNAGELIGKTGRFSHVMALLPLTLQSSMFLSFFYLLYTLILNPSLDILADWEKLVTIFPFVIGCLVMSLGLARVGKSRFIPYVVPYFIIDGALQVYCFLETRLRCMVGRCSTWVMPTRGKYYHLGTPIRTD